MQRNSCNFCFYQTSRIKPKIALAFHAASAYMPFIGIADERWNMSAARNLPQSLSTFDHGCTGTGMSSDVRKVGAVSPRPFLLAAPLVDVLRLTAKDEPCAQFLRQVMTDLGGVGKLAERVIKERCNCSGTDRRGNSDIENSAPAKRGRAFIRNDR